MRKSLRSALLAFVFLLAPSTIGWPMTQDRAVELCRDYLATGRDSKRQDILKQLADYRGPIEPVIERLAARSYQPMKSGYRSQEHFQSAELLKRHPDDRLYFVIPPNYRPERPTGLIVFLHGGGKYTSNRAPGATLAFPSPTASDKASGDRFAATGMITVGPSAPARQSYRRWCLEESDDYIADVILECKNRFHIDRDRVFLLGHSMGGFGAYQAALRQPDRFAAIVVSSGSWNRGYWPALRGTPLCLVNGVHDAHVGVRGHHTDVHYGRFTDQILAREKLDHVYFEHKGDHGFPYGRKYVFEYLWAVQNRRRDAYCDRVGLASPNGFRESYCYAVAHNRWLTLDKATAGTIQYDELIPHDDGTFAHWRLEHATAQHRGASLDAVNHRDNTIEVTTRNVARFTVWLHRSMVDVSQPVRIIVDGKPRFQGRVSPSLATAIESYNRRHDWGLIYPMKVVVDMP
jgi:poly(3-hydroxybutyrate) depolymerase